MKTPVIELIDHVWKQSFKACPHSWQAFNNTLRATLDVAITSGFRFHKDDFKTLHGRYKLYCWPSWEDGEGYYNLAASVGNISACQAFETWTGRKPFIFPSDEKYNSPSRRLTLTDKFIWKGNPVKVTSFKDDQNTLIACSYKDPQDQYPAKIKHIYKITNKDMAAERKWLKECQKFYTGMKTGSHWHDRLMDLFDCSVLEADRSNWRLFYKMVIR